jgi:hypothetical protein
MKATLITQDRENDAFYSNFHGYTSGLGIVKSNPDRKPMHSSFGVIKQKEVVNDHEPHAFAEN